MPERRRNTKTMTAADVRQRIEDVLGWVTRDGTRIIVRADEDPGTGKADGVDEPPFLPEVAAVVPIRDLWRLQALEAGRLDAFDAAAAIGERFRDVPGHELEREVTNAVAEVRAENRKLDKQAAVRTA